MENPHLPDTTQAAFKSGQEARSNGKSIHYNPFRNRPNSINHLWSAWNRGWRSMDLQESPEQVITND